MGKTLECPHCGSPNLSATIDDGILYLECMSCGVNDGLVFSAVTMKIDTFGFQGHKQYGIDKCDEIRGLLREGKKVLLEFEQ